MDLDVYIMKCVRSIEPSTNFIRDEASYICFWFVVFPRVQMSQLVFRLNSNFTFEMLNLYWFCQIILQLNVEAV